MKKLNPRQKSDEEGKTSIFDQNKPQIDRLFNPQHASKLDQIEEAANVLDN